MGIMIKEALKNKNDIVTAIVLAGGRGSRMKNDIPKQFMLIDGKPVIYYALKKFQEIDIIDNIILVTGESDISYCRENIVEKYNITKVNCITSGGKERYNSVYNGLMALDELKNDNNNHNISKEAQHYVLIHDGARACITDSIIENCYNDVKKYKACVAAVPVKDTIKIADKDGFAINTPDRSTLWQIQTPQAFEYNIVKEAYQKMIIDDNKGNITDDAMVVEKYSGIKVKMSLSQYTNIKITTPEDMVIAKMFIN